LFNENREIPIFLRNAYLYMVLREQKIKTIPALGEYETPDKS
jgi:hypothetical protein